MADRVEGVEAQDGHRNWGYQNARWPPEVGYRSKMATGSGGIRDQDGRRKWRYQSSRWPPEVGILRLFLYPP